MKLYVVRHASTESSEKKIYCGRTDIPLSETGRREAEALAEKLSGCGITLAFSSPLLRARETAAIATKGKLPLALDERLAERNFGAFERTSVAREDGKRCRYNFAVHYPQGESYLQVAARVYPFLDELKMRTDAERVLIVSHGSACRVIRTYFRDMTDEEFYAYSQPNGSVEEYEF